MKERIYLDFNATTPLNPQVRETLFTALTQYANASSMHEDGRIVAKNVFAAREQVASLIGSDPDEIIFTSGGSESNNTVFNTVSLSLIHI